MEHLLTTQVFLIFIRGMHSWSIAKMKEFIYSRFRQFKNYILSVKRITIFNDSFFRIKVYTPNFNYSKFVKESEKVSFKHLKQNLISNNAFNNTISTNLSSTYLVNVVNANHEFNDSNVPNLNSQNLSSHSKSTQICWIKYQVLIIDSENINTNIRDSENNSIVTNNDVLFNNQIISGDFSKAPFLVRSALFTEIMPRASTQQGLLFRRANVFEGEDHNFFKMESYNLKLRVIDQTAWQRRTFITSSPSTTYTKSNNQSLHNESSNNISLGSRESLVVFTLSIFQMLLLYFILLNIIGKNDFHSYHTKSIRLSNNSDINSNDNFYQMEDHFFLETFNIFLIRMILIKKLLITTIQNKGYLLYCNNYRDFIKICPIKYNILTALNSINILPANFNSKFSKEFPLNRGIHKGYSVITEEKNVMGAYMLDDIVLLALYKILF
ncbi:hypothetical protein H8356DRAFT_1334790 [Neocallimastix lanati (nom. inval.)]|nr:hypothetical protein H8356DRAFT_1334790 [Neocallimastix sp. JGI-2020a]